MKGWVESAITALPIVGGVVDSAISSRTARKNTDRTIAAQKEMAEKAYQREVEMWHMQNEYNSPEEQMKRFGAAGLNPHLVYGQGSSGNASSYPKYSPPDIQYRYAAPAYGAAVGSVLPTLMQVGSWMQNMRLTEERIKGERLSNSRTDQLIQFLMQKNPREISKLDNVLSMYPYQRSLMQENINRTQVSVADLLEDFRYKWGSELQAGDIDYRYASGTGAKAQSLLKAIAERKLKEAQASWTDYNITNPQALIQLVLGGVLGLAGMTMGAKRLSLNKNVRTAPRRIKTFYEKGRRRSQVVDY